MILVDTDVLIWNLRGNEKAANALDKHPGFALSAISYMELIQGMRDKAELRALRQAIHFWEAEIIHVDPAISARASFLVEEHFLSDSLLQGADALIAATAIEHGAELLTGNNKHYKCIDGLEVKTFRP